MAEELTLTNPQVKPEVRNTKFQVVFSSFDWDGQHIAFRLKGENNEIVYAEYGGMMSDDAGRAEATKMMRSLNTANNSTKSMHKRILEKLSADGKIPAGTVTGAPDPA